MSRPEGGERRLSGQEFVWGLYLSSAGGAFDTTFGDWVEETKFGEEAFRHAWRCVREGCCVPRPKNIGGGVGGEQH